MARFGTTVKDVFLWNGDSVSRERYDFVLRLVHCRMTLLLEGIEQADDLNVFVKREPHSYAKISDERYRLICAVSLLDTLIDRLLFSWLMRRVVASAGETPCYVGSTLTGCGYFSLRPKGRDYYCIDKSSWDWTVKPWMVSAFEVLVKQLCIEAPSWWGRLVSTRFRLLFEGAVFRFSDRTRVRQEVGGIMKSGCYLTIVMNSVLQTLIHHVARTRLGVDVPSPRTLGDDTFQRAFEGIERYLAELRLMGARPKPTHLTDYVEFAGMIVTDRAVVPAYWRKHLFSMKYGPETLNEKLKSYQLLYYFHKPMLALIRRAVLQNCPDSYISDIELEAIWHGASYVPKSVVYND